MHNYTVNINKIKVYGHTVLQKLLQTNYKGKLKIGQKHGGKGRQKKKARGEV